MNQPSQSPTKPTTFFTPTNIHLLLPYFPLSQIFTTLLPLSQTFSSTILKHCSNPYTNVQRIRPTQPLGFLKTQFIADVAQGDLLTKWKVMDEDASGIKVMSFLGQMKEHFGVLNLKERDDFLRYSVLGGVIEQVEVALEAGVRPTVLDYCYAVFNGRRDVFRMLCVARRPEKRWVQLILKYAAVGCASEVFLDEMIEWCQGMVTGVMAQIYLSDLYVALAGKGDFVMLQSLSDRYEDVIPKKVNVCAQIAKTGSVKDLQYLRKIGFPWDHTTCHSAALAGNLEILSWAHSNGCPWNHDVYTQAMRSGSMDCFKYALENNCPPDPSVFSHAVAHGVEWLTLVLDHNFPQSKRWLEIAKKWKQNECIALLESRGIYSGDYDEGMEVSSDEYRSRSPSDMSYSE